MSRPLQIILALGIVLAGCSKTEEKTAKTTNAAPSGNPITAPVDYLGAVAQGKKFAEKTIDTVSVNQAVQLFYAQEDRFPKDLSELVAKHYLPNVPAAPPGMRWVYNPQTGEIKTAQQP